MLVRPRPRLLVCVALSAGALASGGCHFTNASSAPERPQQTRTVAAPARVVAAPSPRPIAVSPLVARVLKNAHAQIGVTVSYDPEYRTLAYPNGDVPAQTGVCSDVVVRAFRAGGADLQRLVHEDMTNHFGAYPQKWGLRRPDKNIDHRRVPNLQTFLARQRKTVAKSSEPGDFLPGDVVAWRLNGGLLHIGLVSENKTTQGTPLVIHNIGAGAQEEDVLFAWTIIGHYRYFAPSAPTSAATMRDL